VKKAIILLLILVSPMLLIWLWKFWQIALIKMFNMNNVDGGFLGLMITLLSVFGAGAYIYEKRYY
jgi:hypothetical protein